MRASPIIAANSRWDRPGLYQQPHRMKAVSGGGPSAWSPTDKSGLVFWFKADAGITQSGGLVTQWDDQSGNARHATASGATRPTYTTGALNGLPGVSFPAGTYMDFGTDALYDPTQPFTVCTVWKNTSDGGTWYHVALLVFATVSRRNFALMASNDTNYGDLSTQYTGDSTIGAKPTIKAATDVTTNAVTTYVTVNGSNPELASSWDEYVSNTALTEAVGGNSQTTNSRNRLGAWFDGSLNFIGSIYEIFGYQALLSSTERGNANTYLTGKWAVA